MTYFDEVCILRLHCSTPISFQAVFASEIDNYAGGLWTPFSQLVITHQGYIIICKNAKNL